MPGSHDHVELLHGQKLKFGNYFLITVFYHIFYFFIIEQFLTSLKPLVFHLLPSQSIGPLHDSFHPDLSTLNKMINDFSKFPKTLFHVVTQSLTVDESNHIFLLVL